MITLGSKRIVYNGSWLMAALLLLGFNIFSLSSLFEPSLVGYSEEVRLASSKWQQYEEKRALVENNSKEYDLDQILASFYPHVIEQEKHASSEEIYNIETIGPDLPVLSGILGFSDTHRHKRLLAVVEGKTYAENALVQGYTIDAITERGVTLTKGGIKHFVPAPEVYYSLDHSKSSFNGQSGAASQGASHAEAK